MKGVDDELSKFLSTEFSEELKAIRQGFNEEGDELTGPPSREASTPTAIDDFREAIMMNVTRIAETEKLVCQKKHYGKGVKWNLNR